jgi:hypothetical protein
MKRCKIDKLWVKNLKERTTLKTLGQVDGRITIQ